VPPAVGPRASTGLNTPDIPRLRPAQTLSPDTPPPYRPIRTHKGRYRGELSNAPSLTTPAPHTPLIWLFVLVRVGLITIQLKRPRRTAPWRDPTRYQAITTSVYRQNSAWRTVSLKPDAGSTSKPRFKNGFGQFELSSDSLHVAVRLSEPATPAQSDAPLSQLSGDLPRSSQIPLPIRIS